MSRCCREAHAGNWADLELAALTRPGGAHRRAADTAHVLAVSAGRQVAWDSVRAAAVSRATRGCAECGYRLDLYGLASLAVFVDGRCALLVADLLTPPMLAQLVGPLEPCLR